jgi:hypothetical protein
MTEDNWLKRDTAEDSPIEGMRKDILVNTE